MRASKRFAKGLLLLFGLMLAISVLAAISPDAAYLVSALVLVLASVAVVRPIKSLGLSHRFFNLMVAVFVGLFGMEMSGAEFQTNGTKVASSVQTLARVDPEPTQNAANIPAATAPKPTEARKQAKVELPKPAKPTKVVVSRPAPEPAPPPTFQRRVMYVNASRLNVREGADTRFSKVSLLARNEKVLVIGQDGEWLQVQIGQGKGWVHGAYLTSVKPPERQQATIQRPAKPQLTTAEIKDILIRRSLASYSGRCPCPYNRKSNGHRCGGNSAYSRPGGASPLCFPSDVTDRMVADFRARR